MKTQSEATLYQYEVCPFCLKVRSLLNYKKIPYKIVEVHPLNKKQIAFSKEYKKVPIFVDADGTQVNDSTPIMRYIDRHYPQNPVFETESAAKAKEDEWLKWLDQVLVRALPPLIYKDLSSSIEAFDYITHQEAFSWLEKKIIKYSGAAVMTLVAKKSAKQQKIENPEKHFVKCLKTWEEALEGNLFVGKKKPNAADLAAFGILRSVEKLEAFKWLRKNKLVHEWFNRLEVLVS